MSEPAPTKSSRIHRGEHKAKEMPDKKTETEAQDRFRKDCQSILHSTEFISQAKIDTNYRQKGDQRTALSVNQLGTVLERKKQAAPLSIK